MTTVAEGVESADQVPVLADAGIRMVQGFFYARPMAAEALSDLLQRRTWQPRGPVAAVA